MTSTLLNRDTSNHDEKEVAKVIANEEYLNTMADATIPDSWLTVVAICSTLNNPGSVLNSLPVMVAILLFRHI
jgi:hypothetical protein